MRDCRSKLIQNGKRKVHLLVSFHIFDSLVGRVLVKLIKCLGKHVFPGKKSKMIWRQIRAIAHHRAGSSRTITINTRVGQLTTQQAQIRK